MTAGEVKFALCVESVLNKIPQPEYRQLLVEAIMILSQIVEHDGGKCVWNEVISVDRLVHCANDLFVNEQVGNDTAIYFIGIVSYYQGGGEINYPTPVIMIPPGNNLVNEQVGND